MGFGSQKTANLALEVPWIIAHPVSGEWKIIERFPFLVGGGDEESPFDCRVAGSLGKFCHLDKARGGLKLRFAERFLAAEAELNGGRVGADIMLKEG